MSKYIITDTCDVSTNIAKFETIINQRGKSSGVQKQKIKDLPTTIVSSARSKFESMGSKKATSDAVAEDVSRRSTAQMPIRTTVRNSVSDEEAYAKEVSLLKEVVRKIGASNLEIVRGLKNDQVEDDYALVANDVRSKIEDMDKETPSNDALFQNLKQRYQEIITRLNDENARLQSLVDAQNDTIAEDIKQVETVFQAINGEEEDLSKNEEKRDVVIVQSESVDETRSAAENAIEEQVQPTTNDSETSGNVDKLEVEFKTVDDNPTSGSFGTKDERK